MTWQVPIYLCVICCLTANYRHINGLCCLGVIAVWAPLSFYLTLSSHLCLFSFYILSYFLHAGASVVGCSLNTLWWSGFVWSWFEVPGRGPGLLTTLNFIIISILRSFLLLRSAFYPTNFERYSFFKILAECLPFGSLYYPDNHSHYTHTIPSNVKRKKK